LVGALLAAPSGRRPITVTLLEGPDGGPAGHGRGKQRPDDG
jgi:hypothetical protein